MADGYSNISYYNPKGDIIILIVFDDIIADMNITLVFITQSYFSVPNVIFSSVILNSTHYLIMKILNRRELHKVAVNHSLDIDFRNFINIYKK